MNEYYKHDGITLYNEDAFEMIKRIPDKSIDLVLTDPPYGITACEWDKVVDLEKMWTELKRIGKEKTPYIFTASQPFTTDLINSNRKWFRYELIWEKNYSGSFLLAKKRPMLYHENIIIFFEKQSVFNPIFRPYANSTIKRAGKNGIQKIKEDNNFNNIQRVKKKEHIIDIKRKAYPKSIIQINSETYKRERGKMRFIPTQKPVALMEYLTKTYSNEGDIILDCFMGSGTTGVACKNLGRKFIGSDISQEYCEIAKKRIMQSEPNLFVGEK